MSDPENDPETFIEVRRREAAVTVGRQQILEMECERKLETKKRKIQELLRRNQVLENVLEEIEKENEEEQQEADVEVARRQKVVKLWKMQAEIMKRQRRLENINALILKAESGCQQFQDQLERIDQILEHAHSEAMLGEVERLIEVTPVPISVPASFLDMSERLIKEDEEEIQALR